MEIRRATAVESASLAALWLRSRRASASIPPIVHTDVEVDQWFAQVVLANAEVWVAAASGEVIGLMVLNDEWIDQLYVDPAETGKGVGGALLAASHGLASGWTQTLDLPEQSRCPTVLRSTRVRRHRYDTGRQRGTGTGRVLPVAPGVMRPHHTMLRFARESRRRGADPCLRSGPETSTDTPTARH